MKETRRAAIYAAVISGLAAFLATLPASAQSLGGNYPQTCRTMNGRLVCTPADRSTGWAGTRAYERWGDGSPASGSSAPSQHHFPYTMGSYHTWYGFGR